MTFREYVEDMLRPARRSPCYDWCLGHVIGGQDLPRALVVFVAEHVAYRFPDRPANVPDFVKEVQHALASEVPSLRD